MLNRRGFLGILAGAIAAPVIVRADSLMKIAPIVLPETKILTLDDFARDIIEPQLSRNNLLTFDMIKREAVEMFRNTNPFLRAVDEEFRKDLAFAKGTQWKELPIPGMKIGYSLKKVTLEADGTGTAPKGYRETVVLPTYEGVRPPFSDEKWA